MAQNIVSYVMNMMRAGDQLFNAIRYNLQWYSSHSLDNTGFNSRQHDTDSKESTPVSFLGTLLATLGIDSADDTTDNNDVSSFGFGYGAGFSDHHYEDLLIDGQPPLAQTGGGADAGAQPVKESVPNVEKYSTLSLLVGSWQRFMDSWRESMEQRAGMYPQRYQDRPPPRTWVEFFRGWFPWLWGVSDRVLIALIIVFMSLYTIRRRRRRIRFGLRVAV